MEIVQETMSVTERFEAAIALETVDRQPVFPILVTAAARLCGITQAEAWRNHDAARDAIIKCYKDFGYDFASKPNYYYPQLPGRHIGAPVRNLIPGRQLAEDDLYQIDERVLFDRKDYKRIAALGWNGFWDEHYPVMSHKTVEQFTQMQTMSNMLYDADAKLCEAQGVPILLGVTIDSVLMAFSLCRTLAEFTKDLYQVPGEVEAAMKACCDDLIANGIEVCRRSGRKMAFIVLERGSGFYYRLDVFERFELPFLKRYVDALVSEGIIPWLHFDTDWGINLPYLKQLPRGKCVCDLDGTTDIFRAKEILGGHMCISGDVPAALLSLGKPEEVEAYCRRLIDEVGGGFMLTTGCECPIDVKPENLRAMVETGRSYRGKACRTSVPEGPTAEQPKGVRVGLPAGKIAAALGDLKYDDIRELVEEALRSGMAPLSILDECRLGMEDVGGRYSSGEYFLAELILSAEIFKEVVARIEPLLSATQREGASRGAVVIGTPKGDIHDIGKNIAATLFKATGFTVHDLGVDVAPEAFVEKIVETNARILAMSALITPTFGSMKKTVELLQEKGLRANRFVIIGGGPTTAAVRDYVGADAWSLNPNIGAQLCREFLEKS
jgi:methylmalonyl-CoA mutase cobalamin-binding domain/chain